MAEKIDHVDRSMLVAAQLAAAMTEPGDSASTAVDNLAEVLNELRFRGGLKTIWQQAGAAKSTRHVQRPSST